MKKIIPVLMAGLFVVASCKKENGTPVAVPVQNEAEQGPFPPPVAAPQPKKADDGKHAVMTFDKVIHDFGDVKQGDVVTYSFNFQNTGVEDLIITEAKGTCGCTVPEYPKDPIKPGEKGKIKVSYNSAGKKGVQVKSVNLKTNTYTGLEKLQVKATVQAKDGSATK